MNLFTNKIRLLCLAITAILCWPVHATSQLDFAATGLSISRTGYCIWNVSGEAQCTGFTQQQQQPADLFPIVSIASGSGVNCAIGFAGELRCWGNQGSIVYNVPIENFGFMDVTVGDDYACAIDQSGVIDCWGFAELGRLNAPEGEFIQLDASDQKTCAVRQDGGVACWGWNDLGVTDVPSDLTGAVKVSVGGGVACALLDTGDIRCWGRHSVFPDNGPYMDVAVGGGRADYQSSLLCGLTLSGEIDCRLDKGSDFTSQGEFADGEVIIEAIPSGTGYAAISVHNGTVINSLEGCALTKQGELDCWGDTRFSEPGQDNLGELVVPTDLHALIYSDTAAEIHWTASNDQVIYLGKVTGYEILRDGEHYAVTHNKDSYLFSDLKPGVLERIAVRQLSELGNPGPQSEGIIIDTLNRDAYAPDGSEESYVPPARAIETTGLYALAYGPTTLELFWDRTEQADLAGYEIRRDGQFIAFTAGVSYVDVVPVSDRTYHYDVIAVQRDSNLMFGFSSTTVSVCQEPMVCR